MYLGKRQLSLLKALGSPGLALVVGDRVSSSLVRRGLCKQTDTGGIVCITPAGLRVLADALEKGLVNDAHADFPKDTNHRNQAGK